jgi:hypothetical protein
MSLLLKMLGIAAGAVAKSYAQRRSPGPAGDGGSSVEWFAVEPQAVSRFEASHPDAQEANRVVNAMIRRGSHAAARYYQTELERYERNYPGSEIYVEAR